MRNTKRGWLSNDQKELFARVIVLDWSLRYNTKQCYIDMASTSIYTVEQSIQFLFKVDIEYLRVLSNTY